MKLVEIGSAGLVLTLLASAWSGAGAQPQKGDPVVVLETAKGTVEIQLHPQEAPKTVARILELVKKNFYNGLRFHRVEKGLLVQIGVPLSRDRSREAWWSRSPGTGTPIGVAEISKRRRNVAGAVAMAHAGDPKSADSQFYILMRAAPSLDGDYTVFGSVIRGLDVVRKLEHADVLKKAYIKS